MDLLVQEVFEMLTPIQVLEFQEFCFLPDIPMHQQNLDHLSYFDPTTVQSL